MLQALSLLYIFPSCESCSNYQLLLEETSLLRAEWCLLYGHSYIRSAKTLCEYIQRIFYSIFKKNCSFSQILCPSLLTHLHVLFQTLTATETTKNNSTKMRGKTQKLRQVLLPCLTFLAIYKEIKVLFQLHSNYCITQGQWRNISMFD